MIRSAALAFALFPSLVSAGDIAASDAYVPLAPKGAMAHAAYMKLTNSGTKTRSLIGLKAPAYAMVHLHQSNEQDGVATMTAMDQVDIKPGQTIVLEPGGLHVMLMKPSDPVGLGDTVDLTLEFANGETLGVAANVVRLNGS
ncbi:copper chaperone PCu(A)C [bacterium]|nr:copper chaperone PCu(A)C [bacterium]